MRRDSLPQRRHPSRISSGDNYIRVFSSVNSRRVWCAQIWFRGEIPSLCLASYNVWLGRGHILKFWWFQIIVKNFRPFPSIDANRISTLMNVSFPLQLALSHPPTPGYSPNPYRSRRINFLLNFQDNKFRSRRRCSLWLCRESIFGAEKRNLLRNPFSLPRWMPPLE